MSGTDTIVAIATAPGRGAIGILRVSGAEAPRVAAALLGKIPKARVASFARFLGDDGGALDEGLAIFFPAPHSFTGEPVLELHGHGGPVVLGLLLQRALGLGCRAARAGEFSERAFLNGKLDLAQAEAIADLIDAGTAAAARAAERSLQGELSRRVGEIKTQLIELRVYVEAAIDFPDEGIDSLGNPAITSRLQKIFASFDALAAAARQGVLLRDGFTVVIAGKPNAGKSTLLNRLSGQELAIVTPLPGTTRDVLRAHIEIDGLPLHIIDTAGLRHSSDVIEVEGIRRAKHEMGRADRMLYVQDCRDGTPTAAELGELPKDVPITVVMNKIDLLAGEPRLDAGANPSRVDVSAETSAGLDLLRVHLHSAAGYTPVAGNALAARQRHLDALARAKQYVIAASEVQAKDAGHELFAEELRLAQCALGEITGEYTSEDLLGEIFSSFCIGK
jgi:tRNA modification GTPase